VELRGQVAILQAYRNRIVDAIDRVFLGF